MTDPAADGDAARERLTEGVENDDRDSNRSSSSLEIDGAGGLFSDAAAGGGGTGLWSPTGNWFKDFCFFCGPGWFVSIAYVDPGNYQADIQAGSMSRYSLLFAVWWTSALSVYVQVLCVRLAYRGNVTLAQAQARDAPNRYVRYMNWFIAEVSTVLTDLPEVIGIGIALHHFFGWPYYVGVLLSLLTTMIFLATMSLGIQILEFIIFLFVAVMSVALFVELSVVKPDTAELLRGWAYGFVDVQSDNLFAIAGILGAVVMPHNLYLHTAAVRSRPVQQTDDAVGKAIKYSSIEPMLPIFISFFINMAVVAIAAERVYGTPGAEDVGISDFCLFFEKLKGGCWMWGIALLAAGQSSAITTTYTGQYVMDGFLNIRLPVARRAILTRLVAISPCVLVSVLLPDRLDQMVNIVNAALSFLLPFALSPLVRYNCSPVVMGESGAATGTEKHVLRGFAVAVWAVNALALSSRGGGFFGDAVHGDEASFQKTAWIAVEVCLQVFYALWNFRCLFTPVKWGEGAVSASLVPGEEPSEDEDSDESLVQESRTTPEIT